MGKILIHPVNRMEGHLGIEANTIVGESNGVRVQSANLMGQLYRSIEKILQKRDARDAMVISQTICGVDPIGHGSAASQCVGTLLGYKVHYEDPLVTQATGALPANAARLRNMVHVSNHMMSHILHLYQLIALDYIKPVAFVGGSFVPITKPFFAPRYNDNY